LFALKYHFDTGHSIRIGFILLRSKKLFVSAPRMAQVEFDVAMVDWCWRQAGVKGEFSRQHDRGPG
jgi:hypothetical protein